MKLVWKILIVIIVAVLLLSAATVFYVKSQLSKPAGKDKTVILEVKQGESVSDILADLKSKEIVSQTWVLQIYLAYKGKIRNIKAGTYEVSGSQTIKEIAEILGEGKEKIYKITIPEGFTLNQIAEKFEKSGLFSAEDFKKEAIAGNFEYNFLKKFSKEASLEGYLFPDTYYFKPKTTPKAAIVKILDNFEKKTKDLQTAAKGNGKNFEDIIVMASILEKEVRVPKDMALVAGILEKRIAIGQALQVDSTINYITGKSEAAVSGPDLEIQSLYNTYKNKGLPPGPISNPGLAVIKAALSSQKSDYLYYLSRQDTGETIFSKTYQEHLEAKQKYLK